MIKVKAPAKIKELSLKTSDPLVKMIKSATYAQAMTIVKDYKTEDILAALIMIASEGNEQTVRR